MGVSGSGKTTIGQLLAKELSLPFYDADDFHPEANIQKMKSGIPLNDEDRQPWLERLAELARNEIPKLGAVISCSALKQHYRKTLTQGIESACYFIFLEGAIELIHERMKKRVGHFMPVELLQTQFDTLENPDGAIRISIEDTPEDIVRQIINKTSTMNNLSEFGLIGLGVMGKSLSLNLAEKGFRLSLYNRHEAGFEEKVAEHFIHSEALLNQAKGFDDLEQFVQSLNPPRKIFMMIKAGAALDKVIESLLPHLDKGDILIDGGNSHYRDTSRRMKALEAQGYHYIGSGVSGGEEGARRGPSIMPGGSPEAYQAIKAYLEAIAAKDKNGLPCCAFIGKGGAGHFVKMVHNGIEYAEMQLIAECYGLLRYGAGYSPDEIAKVFESWMKQNLGSYLLEISIDILRKREGQGWLIDKILDKAGNKGTGSWTSIAAAELGVPVTMITAALYARYTSSYKTERLANHKLYNISKKRGSVDLEYLKSAYQLARIINHHQGMQLIVSAGKEYDWQLNLSEIARIWTNGCIIRSQLMEVLVEKLKTEENILNVPEMIEIALNNKDALANILLSAIKTNIETPCLMAAYQYLLAYTSAQSTANMIQAQRDFFGAHTYQRVDDPSEKFYHTNWQTQ